MTDKEQIMIDGVDVSKCGFLHPEISKTQCHIALAFSDQYEECTNCEQIEDCYFKQLAHKTQECEELKKKLRKLELENTTLQNRYQQVAGATTEASRYRKALEEIEGVCKNGAYDEFKMPLDECSIILDIINKAKREE